MINGRMGVYNGAMPFVHILVPVVNNDQSCPRLSPRWVIVRYETCARSAVFAMCEILDDQPRSQGENVESTKMDALR